MPQRSEYLSSLKDLDGIRVAVDDPIPPPFSRDTLKSAVETQLRAAMIKVLGLGDFPTGDPHVRVTVSASAARNGAVGVFVQVDFVQIVFMRRNPQVTFNRAQTWKADAQVLLVGTSEVMRAVDREVARQVDQFIADYRAANA
jgi:hypothetical protein